MSIRCVSRFFFSRAQEGEAARRNGIEAVNGTVGAGPFELIRTQSQRKGFNWFANKYTRRSLYLIFVLGFRILMFCTWE